MKLLKKINAEILLLIFFCIVAFSLRSYETYRDLVFTYDQGRDAHMMQKIASGRPTFIGPVTGLDGVYLGPFWYYLIFPFYMIGGGNPVFAAFEMKLFSVGVVILLYLWFKKAKLVPFGFVAIALYTVSFSNIIFARWLSNPVPLPFFSLLGFYILWNALERKKLSLYALTGFIFGCCLQLEAANAIWFVPTTAALYLSENYKFLTKQWKTVLSQVTALGVGFSLTVLPQFLFELKNNFLITKNLLRAFQTTHDISILESIPTRFPLLLQLYGKGIFESHAWIFIFVSILFVCSLILFYKQFWASRAWRISFFWFVIPFVFHLLYTGNHGNFWDYYIIAQHVSLYILLAMSIGIIAKLSKWRELALILATGLVLSSVFFNLRKWTEMIPPYPSRFSLEQQVEATHWMIAQANSERYGVWVYTPSSQDDPYRYIFSWVGKQTGVYPGEHVEQEPIIFLVAEDDTVFWGRHRDWIQDRMEFGTLLERKRFGSIVVYKLRNTFILSK